MYSTTISTPTGPFTLIADDEAVYASGWTADSERLRLLIAPSLRPAALATGGPSPFAAAAAAYHEGELGSARSVPVNQSSGPFLEHAWDVLRDVAPGQPISYTEFADLAGNPRAVRAAASACARNTAALFVPCHRVIRSDGTLGGFRWGLDVKAWLLDHES